MAPRTAPLATTTAMDVYAASCSIKGSTPTTTHQHTRSHTLNKKGTRRTRTLKDIVYPRSPPLPSINIAPFPPKPCCFVCSKTLHALFWGLWGETKSGADNGSRVNKGNNQCRAGPLGHAERGSHRDRGHAQGSERHHGGQQRGEHSPRGDGLLPPQQGHGGGTGRAGRAPARGEGGTGQGVDISHTHTYRGKAEQDLGTPHFPSWACGI